MTAIHPQQIFGNWTAGFALDFHTTSSTAIGENEAGHMQFDTVRPEIAELLFRMKYRSDLTAIAGIVAGAVGWLAPRAHYFDLIVPVPPSSQRPVQPVLMLANAIGRAIGKPVANCITTTRATTQLKGVSDPAERQALVAGLYAVDPDQTRGKNVLLFDDLYRSGTTMNAITDVLMAVGQAQSVRALTITKTRSNQ